MSACIKVYVTYVPQLHFCQPVISLTNVIGWTIFNGNSCTKFICGLFQNAGNEVKPFLSALMTYPLRLKPGQELVSSLNTFITDNQLQGAFILTCVGSLTKITLRMANSTTVSWIMTKHNYTVTVCTINKLLFDQFVFC